ncbi:MAG: sulfite exporter TauE/SafE family protein [Chloroflexi bacterium]|nr:sulfite exporter TauE/SafE family protein [Chloroflexota bacterium]
MWAVLLLGLTGSLGHCVGMCSGVALLLGRRGQARGWRVIFLHLGRVTTYGLLGAAAGSLGFSIMKFISYCAAALSGQSDATAVNGLLWLQGGLALLTAVLSIYMALALLGQLPSPELFFTGFTRRWGQLMRRVTASPPPANPPTQKANILTLYGLGMLWGALPCGLVMTALVAAAVAGSPQRGALTMLAFGLGTYPVTIGVSLAARLKQGKSWPLARPSFRYAAAALIMLFGVQMALRGLAAWGWVGHFHLGTIMLW